MKFNDKLNLVDYLKVINEIVSEYFDDDTYEYTPHVGEINALRVYYDYCVELENGEGTEKKKIEDINEMIDLFENNILMDHFNTEIDDYDSLRIELTFGHAYNKAMEIVEYKKVSANSFANTMTFAVKAILDAFKSSFTEDDINKVYEIAKQISSGKLSNQGIVDAYGETKFAENDDAQKDDKVIPITKNKE